MAARKTYNLLPTVFQSDTNKKFLAATMDQLVTEPDLKTVYGYIGRKFAPTYKTTDSYILESTDSRQNYQLEPSVVIRDKHNDVTFFASYLDLLDKIDYYGGLTNDHSRLFEQEYYSFDPMISYDKFVNFSQYYWIPNGPPPVEVSTSGVDLTATYVVTRDAANKRYVFTNNGVVDNSLMLARGGRYEFVVNQPGVPFWIQTETGIDGVQSATPTISSREIYGVENNGIDVGIIYFNVPQTNAQDRYLKMPTVATVDYATPIPYSEFQNRTVSQLIAAYPEYTGIASQLNGKHLIFVDQQNLTNVGDEIWTNPVVHDNSGNVVAGYDAGTIVAENQRFGVWRVVYVDAGITNADGSNDPLVKLIFDQTVQNDEKVYIKYGVTNANKEYYKEYDGFYYQMPVITCALETMWIQDGARSDVYASTQIVNYAGWIINATTDIIGQKNYTSPNSVEFTSGLKIQFGDDVTPAEYQNRQYYVEGVGDNIRLVPVDELVTPELYNDENALNYPDEIFPDYITINRASVDRNAWSRNNRWFHVDVITASAAYNNTTPSFTNAKRGQRPIVQFENDLQLINEGRIGRTPIDILDTSTANAFVELQGKTYTTAFGITLFDGMRVVFGADIDPLVKNKIYVLNLVQYEVDTQGLPTGDKHIELTLATDGAVSAYDTVVVKLGQYKGSQWWYDGVQWNASQAKIGLQQCPLYDVFDITGKSLSTYVRSTFVGTDLFGYVRNTTGTNDSVLGFPLSYKNFSTQGDIKFQNFFNTDTFTFVNDAGVIETAKISLGYIQKIVDASTLVPRNTWLTVPEPSKQYQQISYIYNGNNSPFAIDILPTGETSVPYIKVYHNFAYLQPSQWALANNAITVSTTLTSGDQVDVLVYSKDVSALGFYQVPQNLDLNAQNIDIDTLTLGQVRNHLVALSQNSTIVDGNVLGQSNLRDIDIKQQGGTILQHSAPVPYASLFLIDNTANFINSLRYAQQEYTKFKNKFLELSTSLQGIDSTDPAGSVDTILAKINIVKNKTFPWYYSDMVPYGPLKNTVTHTVFNPLKTNYEITNIFDDEALSNQAILIYLNGVQLINTLDYTFNATTPSVDFLITLTVGDIISIQEYSNTDGNYIPETPSKLGLWPKYNPEKFLDDTYRTPIYVIRGHDGSITPAFGDYRDDFLLELEKRIYNNIKLPQTSTFADILSVIPGKFRNSDYSLAEINQIISQPFLNWVGNNKLDFTLNSTFEANDQFTWNYSTSTDRIDGANLPGSWRACFQYFYDTFRPHITPWEMLGFTVKPDWWEGYYGPGPYTGGNKVLWADLEAGNIRYGTRAGIDTNYARPGLSQIIPVDENGNLLSPAQVLARTYNGKRSAGAWAIGQYGPTEYAWRTSSEFPFAVQQALALAKPAKYFGQLIDTYNYTPINSLYTIDETATGEVTGSEQYLTLSGNHHLTQDAINFNGDIISGTVYRGAGYLNWIADYLINQGINPAAYITPMLRNFNVNLAYKVGGFTDQKYVEVLAEQVSPSSTNDSILIPNENYIVHLNTTPVPTQKLIYSAVIVEKTTNGYSVRGYDLFNSYFTIIPSITNNNGSRITVLKQSAIVFNDYQPIKVTVPYGYEFTSIQQVADFLVSYERYLLAQGFTFDDADAQLGEMRNWKLSIKEFLYWAQQGWKPGSLLVLSPVAETLNGITIGAITEGIEDSQYGSKILDQNFNLIKNNSYDVYRTPTSFKISLNNSASVIGYVEINLVQYEHTLIFDNTTVFNDVIYQPESGNRQYRLKLIGQKTAAWDGSLSIPGFMYSSGIVDEWNQGKDYLKGDLVQYKTQYYTALENIIANSTFQFQFWQEISASQIQKGLLSNFSTLAVESQSYYDSYAKIRDNDQMAYSHALIGYKPRQYLSDLGLSETSQIEFYKGFIAQKGTANAVNQMLKASFNNLSSDISFYEEWAMRVGEYGALNSNPFLEIPLNEKAFGVNPSVAQFVGAATNNLGDGVTVFNESQLYKSYGKYTANIALNRTANSRTDNDIPTAGYVNIDDVDVTIFDLANYVDLDGLIGLMGSGFIIWCAKDFSQDWNVYRVTETNNSVIQVTNSMNSYVTFTTDTPHKLVAKDVFLVKDFDPAFDGFYQVTKVVNATNMLVVYKGDLTNVTTISSNGMLFRMDSMRFKYMEDSRVYGLSNPPNGWKAGDKIWIDDDAATTSVQGQPYTTPDNTWKVYEKQYPWNYDQQLLKGSSEYANTDGYGTSVKMSSDGLIVAVGSPTASGGVGYINTFLKNYAGEFVESFGISPLGANTRTFGSAVDLATDAKSTTTMAVGAPASGEFGNGYVYVYTKPVSSSAFDRTQILVGNTGDSFGSSIAFNQDGEWLYVGAPGNNTVYAYGLNRFVPIEEQLYSAENKNTIFLSTNPGFTIYPTDVITQAATGARASIKEVVSATELVVDNLTNFVYVPVWSTFDQDNLTWSNVAANISITSGSLRTETNAYPNNSTSVSITNSIPLDFVPAVTDDANSLLITSGAKTYIPTVDYTLSGSTVTFISGNVAQSDISIKQQPFYQFLQELPIPTSNTWARYGEALSSSFDGAQLAVGAPGDTVMGAGGVLLPGAGSVWVYDRVIEAFNSVLDAVPGTGGQDYQTQNDIAKVYKVTLDNVEVTNYTVVGSNIIRFNTPPAIGQVVYIEVNKFNLLERIVGTASLEGDLSAIQANAAFGTSLTICSNNCAIYIGAPYWDNGTQYNSGAVWKFHNRGRLYGTDTGYVKNPIFTVGDTIRLNNFEVVVNGRLMPGTNGNILTLSSNITAYAGNYITQTGSSANLTVVEDVINTNTVTVTGNWSGLHYGSGNIVAINGANVTAYPVASLNSLVKDINDADILGVSATNENGFLRLDSDVKVSKDQLRILSGTTSPGSIGPLAAADMIVFAYMQIIVNPYGQPGEYFGNKVKLASNAYMLVIGSARGSTKEFTTFDVETTTNGTTFDAFSTRLFEAIPGSGSVYIYELYDDPRNAVEDPGRYSFCQQLDPGSLVTGSRFGTALDIEGTFITVSAPGSTVEGSPEGSGTVYIFQNPTRARGWNLIRYQQATVDIDSVSRIYLYDNQKNQILDDLQFIDPAKGRILGAAEQDITFKTEYDPAIYNRGNSTTADINANVYWGENHIAKVWWDLSKVRYLDYEQDTLTYRSLYWGQLFPGSSIDVYEWVESSVPPSQYVEYGGNGTPKHADDSAYVEEIYVDPVTNIITTRYFYWVGNKTTVDPNNPARHLPVTAIADYIANPKNQNIAFAAAIRSDALAFYNVSEYLSADNTIMHLDYQYSINTDIIHSEYELVQKGNPNNPIPVKLVDKLVDSLSGIDSAGATVPDPKLSLADRYGINIRPRQSMFVDRLSAVNELIIYVNSIFAENAIAEQFSLAGLMAEDPQPNIKLGEYHESVETETELAYIDTTDLDAGHKVLVLNDTTQNGLWVLYELTADKVWSIIRVQSYKTSLYWSYTDWYATGYSAATKPTFSVNTTVDALKLAPVAGSIIYIANATGNNTWQLVVANADGTLQVVGIQNGTIQLSDALGDFVNNNLGFANQDFDSNRFDQSPNDEIRAIIQALNNDIFVNTLQGKFNDLFFVLVNYLLTEQNYVDWLFKSSFVSITHKLRTLSQYPSFVVDNQTYYQNYIEEVKPYRTKIREYLLDYTGEDTFSGDITDFDLPAEYNTTTGYGIFRSPSGESPYVEVDEAAWQTFPYNQWYNNRGLQVGSIRITEAGANYITPPTVTITNTDGNGFGANAYAIIDGNTGSISSIVVTSAGANYTTTPTVTINGSATTPATAYAVLTNPMVRNFDTTIKFDRTTYDSNVQYWSANTVYSTGQIITHAMLDGNVMVRKAYRVKSSNTTKTTFIPAEYDVYAASNFNNASDRIIGYYEPTSVMPVVDVITVPLTVANISTNANKLYVHPASGIIPGMYISSANVPAGYITSIRGNVDITIDSVPTKVTEITLDVAVSLATDTTINARYDSLDQLVSGISYPSMPMVGSDFKVNPKFGRTYDIAAYDPVQYSKDGIALLSTNAYEVALYSMYANVALGSSPADLVSDGGLFIDEYHSRAPEELVPGITYDTLDMRVFTKINGNANVVAYRVFNNMLNETSYTRISSANTTKLAQPLRIADANVYVANAAVLSSPNTTFNIPGVIYINGERITFFKVDLVNNVLSQIRRGTQGTGAEIIHAAGTDVIDAGINQVIPGTSNVAQVITTATAGQATFATPEFRVSDTTFNPMKLRVIVNGVPAFTSMYVENATTTSTIYQGTDGGIFWSNVAYGNTITFISGLTAGAVVTAEVITNYANVWYNGRDGSLDGTGLTGSNTTATEFLKQRTMTGNIIVGMVNALGTEDAINTLTTEDGQTIYTEE